MPFQLSANQVEQLNRDKSQVVVVQDSRTKQKFVVLSQETFERARPLFDYLTTPAEPESSASDWSAADNERRAQLINQKSDRGLSRAEAKELEGLQQRAYRHRALVAPVKNDLLKLLADALERQVHGRTEQRE